MNTSTISDSNIKSFTTLMSPLDVKNTLPTDDHIKMLVQKHRNEVRDILDKKDHRFMLIVGPCSIHDPDAAIEYAKRLKQLSDQVRDTCLILMRVYFEKPRTTVGWKGLINDPLLNNSFEIEHGLISARKLMIDIANLGLPIATEALDPISPQYLQDLVTWSAIGARTTESQTHREMASGLSSSVGFKNGTDGSITSAINALKSASSEHQFLGVNKDGAISIVSTAGNPYAHLVLRGGGGQPNYQSSFIESYENELKKQNLPLNIIVDCSHENSAKNPDNQPFVLENIIEQIEFGNQSIIGAMLESNLNAGRQDISENMQYGVSVTDACINWETTEEIILNTYNSLKTIIDLRNQGFNTQLLSA